ncbi:MAG: hypothetical protein Q9P14_15470, partial [candidate division KSB1 bacterium]|nr:hypothetical protein [candidate division KSB1 bacterium]
NQNDREYIEMQMCLTHCSPVSVAAGRVWMAPLSLICTDFLCRRGAQRLFWCLCAEPYPESLMERFSTAIFFTAM